LRDNEQVNGLSMRPPPSQPGETRARRPRWFASARSADPPAALTGRQIAADIALAMAVAAASLAIAVLATRNPQEPVPGPFPVAAGGIGWQALLPAVATRAAPLAIRRFRPLTAFWLCLAACVLAGSPEPLRGFQETAVDLCALVPAACSAVVHTRYRGAALLSMPASVVIFFPGVNPAQSSNYMLLVLLLLFTAVLVVTTAARRASASQTRLLRVQQEQEDATLQAIGRERARIASELHDVVTHNVSMMVVQAGAARRVLGASPDEARSALLAIEESGREAIVELQHMLGLLAPPGEPEDGGVTGAGEPLRPQPGLDQIRPLLNRVTAAGLPAELRIRGTPRTLPPGMDLAAYRVVQEALTNVIKHAGPSSATVTLDYQQDALMIEVADDVRPGGAGPGGAGPGRPAAPGTLGAMPGSGRGLLGLRERVLLYGGELEAGRPPGGGWRVRARRPEQPAPARIPALP
jgi:signal transduction histidine kinase